MLALTISGLFWDLVVANLESESLWRMEFSQIFYFWYIDDVIKSVPQCKIGEILAVLNAYVDCNYEWKTKKRLIDSRT